MRSRPGKSRSVIVCLALAAVVAGALVFLPSAVLAQPAPNPDSVLILASVNGGGRYSAAAVAAGHTVVLATDAQWAGRTTAEFHTFRALIVGDPVCGGVPPAAAVANAATWAAAVDGPILIDGTDEVFHFSAGGGTFITSAMAFVTSGTPGQTGAHISLSCYYDGSPNGTPVPLIAPFGSFTVGGASCFNDVHIVAVHPALAGSTDATLSNWSCSIHEFFNTFPSSTFIPLAIARNATGVGELTFGDGSHGIPYMLASGAGIVPIGTPAIVPTLSFPMLALLTLGLAVVALMLMRRS